MIHGVASEICGAAGSDGIACYCIRASGVFKHGIRILLVTFVTGAGVTLPGRAWKGYYGRAAPGPVGTSSVFHIFIHVLTGKDRL